MRAGVALLAGLIFGACTTQGDGAILPSTQEAAVDTASTTSMSTSERQDGYAVCWSAAPSSGTESISFADNTAASGLAEALTGMRGHAAAWGDIDGDGIADLFVGTFATARTEVYQERGASGPAPDRVLFGASGTFELVEGFPEQFGRTSGAAMVDLDGDGDLDLVVSRNATDRDDGAGTAVFENTSNGFVERESGIDPGIGGRSVGVLDYDSDGLLDLVILEDHYRGGSSRLYRNAGDFEFEDTTGAASGFPDDVHGLGLATGDLNNDGLVDLFVAGSNRLFAGTGQGFAEVADAVGEWETFGPEDDVSGAAIADVNRDGWLDLVVGHHFNSTISRGSNVPIRLYLNETADAGGSITLSDVTESAGLIGLPTKAPHVELADIDNDGWPDIVTSASAADGSLPAVFRHIGLDDGIPQFSTPEGLGSAQYWVTSPTADIDRDGRLDLLAVEWEPALPSIMFMNETASGHWLRVSAADTLGGVGTRVDVYRAGMAGDVAGLLASREITATVGYTAGVELVAHFGLGETTTVDLVVSSPGGEVLTLEGVAADQQVQVGGNC